MSRTTRPVRVAAEVRSNQCEGGVHWRLRLRVPGWPGFEPGQFVMLSPGVRSEAERFDPLLPRPMAVFRTHPGGNGAADLEVVYQIAGRGTRLLAEARSGERVGVVGPLGRAFPLPQDGEGALLIGGGTGVASLFELATRLVGSTPVRVLLGARSVDALMGLQDFGTLDVDLALATEDGSAGRQGLVTELLEEVLSSSASATLYACGPTPMMRRCAELAAARERSCLVSLENTMACGFGVCLGCAVPKAGGTFALVCRDGPVFDARTIAWPELP